MNCTNPNSIRNPKAFLRALVHKRRDQNNVDQIKPFFSRKVCAFVQPILTKKEKQLNHFKWIRITTRYTFLL